MVEYGGDIARDSSTPPNITSPQDICPELVRANNSVGPSISKDEVGTSYAAPKIANLAAQIQEILPGEPTLLYRALIAQSARWPTGLEPANSASGLHTIKTIGYGVPDGQRAVSNNQHRVTLFTKGLRNIKARDVQIFRVPVPAQIGSQANEQDILVEICLSYAAQPRRTRRLTRGYLGVWADWEVSRLNESVASFQNRVSKDIPTAAEDGDSIPWTIGKFADKNKIHGVRRNVSTLQKDWAIVKAHQLPNEFCIAVVGHPGWDSRLDAFAKYSLVVSFEAINKDLEIYNPIKVEIDRLTVAVPPLEVE